MEGAEGGLLDLNKAAESLGVQVGGRAGGGRWAGGGRGSVGPRQRVGEGMQLRGRRARLPSC